MAKRLLLPAALLLVLPAFLFAQVGTSGQTGSPHVALVSMAPQTQATPRVAPHATPAPRTPAPRVAPAARVNSRSQIRVNPDVGRGVMSQHQLEEARERAAHRAEEFSEHRVIPAYPYYAPYAYYYDPFYYPGYYTALGPGYWNYAYNNMSDYTGRVHIKDAPKDAAVFINGSFAGTVGQLKKFNLDPGRYTIEVRVGDRDIAEQSVYVVAGRTIDIHARG